MAGTPQQKQAALSLAAQPQNNLADVARRAQVRTQATGQEQVEAAKSEDLKALGGLGDRVKQFMDAQRQAVATAAQQAQDTGQGVGVQVAPEFQGKDLSNIKDLLGQLRADPNNMQLQLQVNKELGYNIEQQLPPEKINQLYESAVTSIGRGAAGSIDDDLNVDDLIATGQFEYDKPQLSALLGVPEDQLGKLTVGQIRDEVTKLQQEEFSRSSLAGKQAVSSQLGAAERGLARQQGRELSQTGVRATEADVQKLEDQISNADQVQFAGKTYKVDDLLRDETISGIISEYMNSSPDSDIRKHIDQDEPALKQFIDNNQAILSAAAEHLSTGATGFQGIQEFNKGLQNFGTVQVAPEIAAAVIPGYGELQAQKVDTASVPLLDKIQKVGSEGATKIGSELNAQITKDPGFANEVKDLTRDDWDKLNIEGDGRPWQNYKKIIDQNKVANEATAPEEIISQLFNDVSDPKELSRIVNQDYVMDVLGNKGGINNRGLITLVDTNDDGVVDDPSTMKNTLMGLNPKLSLKETVEQGRVPYARRTLGKPPVLHDEELSLFQKLGNATKDGRVDGNEIRRADLNFDELFWLARNGHAGNVDVKTVEQIIDKKRKDETDSIVDKYMKPGRPYSDVIEDIKHEIKSRGKEVDTKALSSIVDNMQDWVKTYGDRNIRRGDEQAPVGTNVDYAPY
jgi:hypothetical protein